MTEGTSNSQATRRVVIENPSAELAAAIAAQVSLPADTAMESWRVTGVKLVEADVRITRTTKHGSEGTTEQPIVWDEPRG